MAGKTSLLAGLGCAVAALLFASRPWLRSDEVGPVAAKPESERVSARQSVGRAEVQRESGSTSSESTVEQIADAPLEAGDAEVSHATLSRGDRRLATNLVRLVDSELRLPSSFTPDQRDRLLSILDSHRQLAVPIRSQYQRAVSREIDRREQAKEYVTVFPGQEPPPRDGGFRRTLVGRENGVDVAHYIVIRRGEFEPVRQLERDLDEIDAGIGAQLAAFLHGIR